MVFSLMCSCYSFLSFRYSLFAFCLVHCGCAVGWRNKDRIKVFIHLAKNSRIAAIHFQSSEGQSSGRVYLFIHLLYGSNGR